MGDLRSVLDSLQDLSAEDLRKLLHVLRTDHRLPLHRLEDEFHTKAEVILESIARATELTRRMLRGVIAEAIFKVEVIDNQPGWEDVSPDENSSADFILHDGQRPVRIQVKLQRREKGVAKTDGKTWFVETQKTRNGKDKEGTGTRLYHFGEFDILAVCMEPSTGRWESFMFTLERNLAPLKGDSSRMAVMQPVPMSADDKWTFSFEECLTWFRELN